jgi:hypothetical protein
MGTLLAKGCTAHKMDRIALASHPPHPTLNPCLMIGMDHMQQPDQPGNFAGSDLKEIGVIPVLFFVTSNGPRASIPFKDSAAASRCSLATWEAASLPLNLLPSELLAKVRLFEDYIIFGIVIIFWVWVWELLSLILQWFELIFLVGRNFESNPN